MKRLLQAYRCRDTLKAKCDMQRWYETPLGQQLQQAELELMQQVMPNLFGYHLLQVGRPMEGDLVASSRIGHRITLLEHPSQLHDGEGFIGTGEQLPIAADCLDVVILPHLLEFAEHPHQLLREVERVLIPEGHLVLLGFNPFSLFGLRRLVSGWRSEAPWCGHFYSTVRIRDWLSLLGFDTVLQQHYFFRPAIQHPGALQRLESLEHLGQRWWQPLGAGYLLVAKKRVATLTPIKPRWRSRRRLISVGLTEPTARRDKT